MRRTEFCWDRMLRRPGSDFSHVCQSERQRRDVFARLLRLSHHRGQSRLHAKKVASGRERIIGSRGTLTPLHYDIANNFLIQLNGEKKITLFCPEETNRLYPHSFQGKRYHFSRVDIDNPNLKRFPNFKAHNAIEFTLKSGEMLFIPPYWWHQVQGLSPSISINLWRKPPSVLSQMKLLLSSQQGFRAIGSLVAQSLRD